MIILFEMCLVYHIAYSFKMSSIFDFSIFIVLYVIPTSYGSFSPYKETYPLTDTLSPTPQILLPLVTTNSPFYHCW